MNRRSVSIGGSVDQATIIAGDHNRVQQTWKESTALAPGNEKIISSLVQIRDLVSKLNTADSGKLRRAVEDAQEEAAKEQPNKVEIATALQRVVRYAKEAENIGEMISKLEGPLSTIASLLGSAAPVAARLFGLLT